MDKNITRSSILDAANRIVKRDGVAHLTIEAVAQEAGLSKGGVLYHFASKEALIGGMIAAVLAAFEGDLAQSLVDEDATPGSWLRSYIRASCEVPQEEAEAATTLIAAIATYPHLLEPVRRSYTLWQKKAEEDGPSPALATILRLAADGLWLADFFGLAPPTGTLREEVIQTLLDLTRLSQSK